MRHVKPITSSHLNFLWIQTLIPVKAVIPSNVYWCQEPHSDIFQVALKLVQALKPKHYLFRVWKAPNFCCIVVVDTNGIGIDMAWWMIVETFYFTANMKSTIRVAISYKDNIDATNGIKPTLNWSRSSLGCLISSGSWSMTINSYHFGWNPHCSWGSMHLSFNHHAQRWDHNCISPTGY